MPLRTYPQAFLLTAFWFYASLKLAFRLIPASSFSLTVMDDPLKILALQALNLGAGALPSADPALLRRAAVLARLRPPLADNLSFIASHPADAEIPVAFPAGWKEESRRAVRQRLRVLADVQRSVLRAHAALASGDLAGAAEAVEGALRMDPSDLAALSLGARALTARAEGDLARGDARAAEEGYARALAMDPGDVDALTALSWLRYTEGSREAAESLLRRAIREAPWIAILHYRLGLVRFEEGDLSGSESSLLAAFDLDPRQPEPLLLLGDVARRRGDEARARDLYARALDLGGRVAETRTALAILHLEAGRNDEATTEIEAALRAKPGDPEALLARARIRAARGDRDGARQDLLSALASGGPPFRARAMAVAPLRSLLTERAGEGVR